MNGSMLPSREESQAGEEAGFSPAHSLTAKRSRRRLPVRHLLLGRVLDHDFDGLVPVRVPARRIAPGIDEW